VTDQSEVLGQVKKMLNRLEETLEGVSLIRELSTKTSDRITSSGELLSSYIISKTFVHNGLDAVLKNCQELIVTDSNHSNATVIATQTSQNIASYFTALSNDIVVLPGFVASSEEGEFTTLGRGGSDYTASLIAAATNASLLEIWTDVSGMYTAHPGFVRQAKPIVVLSYQEAMELSHFGAKVLYPPTIQPVLEKEIPIRIRNTFEASSQGTLIAHTGANGNVIKGISHMEKLTLLTLEGSGMIGIPGFSARLFAALAASKINITLITQASSEHSICVAIDAHDTKIACKAVEEEFEYEMSLGKLDPLVIEPDNAIVALVGDNMKNHQGISGKMFSTLGRNNVNIRAIAQGASEKNISAVISEKDIKKALNTLHSAFFEDLTRQLNLFVIGVGNVGGRFLEMLRAQQSFLTKQLKLQVRVVGLASSKKMIFKEEGVDLDAWKAQLNQGDAMDLSLFHDRVRTLNYRNSIFVDNTASDQVASTYASYLKESVAVVTCNKIACSSGQQDYTKLKALAREFNAQFLFETNVGAGLPIIDTLNNLVLSGDRVRKIRAVLSGSLNYIFNHYNGEVPFHDIVIDAGEAGYTEPDPRIDLSGVDVMRKILILARESGFELELDDIKNETFLPDDCLNVKSVSDFMEALKKGESHFNSLVSKAQRNSCKLKYVAEFTEERTVVGLREIPVSHPFYDLEGKDNIVLFHTDRYAEQPLIVKGAGAGADVTASGIFADIIRIGKTA
jgi:aspartokinase/homoserine dehydrogenase 1